MKADKKTEPDQIEKEMKLLIEKLNNENAALGKILLNMGEKKSKEEKPAKVRRKKNTGSQLQNQNLTE
ncbi:MAG: hypothetical protein CVT94_00075 [Bacteroidetes bacterium HGW-Bacteroidetes-11]|jgi:hypothetical protein|nr:MAG: hypothetical protein CVT94_00075 [Bacteroidetes bacterium HGW-Bacteroidetes-11]